MQAPMYQLQQYIRCNIDNRRGLRVYFTPLAISHASSLLPCHSFIHLASITSSANHGNNTPTPYIYGARMADAAHPNDNPSLRYDPTITTAITISNPIDH